MADDSRRDSLTPVAQRPPTSPTTMTNDHANPPQNLSRIDARRLGTHHPSPSLVSLSSTFSSASLSSSSSVSSGGASEPRTPHSPGLPLPSDHFGSPSSSPSRQALKGPRPRPKIVTQPRGSRPVSVMPTIPSEPHAPARHGRSSSIPDSLNPSPVAESSKGPPQLPRLVLNTPGGAFDTTFSSSTAMDHSTSSSIPTTSRSFPSEAQPQSKDRSLVPQPHSTVSQQSTSFAQPTAHPRTVLLRQDGLVPPSPEDEAPRRSFAPRGRPTSVCPLPPSPETEVDWDKLDRILGTWKAAQKAKSKEVAEIMRKSEEERRKRGSRRP